MSTFFHFFEESLGDSLSEPSIFTVEELLAYVNRNLLPAEISGRADSPNTQMNSGAVHHALVVRAELEALLAELIALNGE